MAILVGGCGSVQEKEASKQQVKYPSKPITIIVPYAPGGDSDMIARSMEKMAIKYLGQPMIVINKPGGGATIGWNELAGSNPDGYTIGITTIGAILQPLYGSTKCNYPTALIPLAQVTTSPMALTVSTESSWQNLNELIEYAKAHPGELKYGHPGLGATANVVAEMFIKEAGVTIEQVPFQGSAEALAALLGGHVKVMFSNIAAVKEQVKAGKVRILAIADPNRYEDKDLKNVPTFKEQGINLVFNNWQGIGAPKGIPDDIQYKLAEGLKNLINDPEFQKNMENLGMKVDYLGPKEFGERWITDNQHLTKVVKETGIAERIAAQKK
jgi:Uncharacterized protein conserved in bacteria